MHIPQPDPNAVAHGDALIHALTQAARGGEIEPIIGIADQIIMAGLFAGARGELVAMMLFHLELTHSELQPSPYYELSVRLVKEGVCTAGEMKAAVCGTLLMRGQQRGWLEPRLYDMLVKGIRGHPGWRLAMSLIERRGPSSSHRIQPITKP